MADWRKGAFWFCARNPPFAAPWPHRARFFVPPLCPLVKSAQKNAVTWLLRVESEGALRAPQPRPRSAAVYGGEPCKTTRVVTARIDACYQPPGTVDRTEATPSEEPA